MEKSSAKLPMLLEILTGCTVEFPLTTPHDPMSNYSVRYSYCPLGWAGPPCWLEQNRSVTEAFSKGTRGKYTTFLPLEKQKKRWDAEQGAVLVTRGLRLLNGLTATLTLACFFPTAPFPAHEGVTAVLCM